MASESTAERVEAAMTGVMMALATARMRIGDTATLLDGRTQDDARRGALATIDTIQARDIARWRQRGAALAAGEPSSGDVVRWEKAGAELEEILDDIAAYVEEAGLGNIAWQTLAQSFADFGQGARVVVDELGKSWGAIRVAVVLALVVGAAVFAFTLAKKVGVLL